MHDSLKDLGDTFGDNRQPGFFLHFAQDAGFKRLTCFQNPAWQRPVAFQWLTAALHKQDAVVIEDQRSNAKDRPLWIPPANTATLPLCPYESGTQWYGR